MTTRLYLILEKDERRALGLLAQQEMRDVRDQARFILRAELERRGLLIAEPAAATANAGNGGNHDGK